MDERLKRDEEIARDDELPQKHAGMFDMLTKLMEESSTRWDSAATSNSYCVKHEEMKLTCLTEKDDVEAYLTTFERVMKKRNGLTN